VSVEEQVIRRPRADGQRNRSAILAAGQQHFLQHGVGASLEAIAKDAGVSVATLYRHFPTREALLAAVLQTRSDELLERRAEIAGLDDAAEALRQWLLALQDYCSSFSGLAEPLMTATREQDPDNPLTLPCDTLMASTEEYLTAAQAAGQARPDLTGFDLFLASMWLAWTMGAGGSDEHSLVRLRRLVESGYRLPSPSRPPSPNTAPTTGLSS
jgi:AcrR family transcriptional regulator